MCKLCDIRYILHVSALFQVNRFLALTKFEGEFTTIFQYEGAMSAYDDFMLQKFAPGILKASYAYIRRFVDWLLFSKQITKMEVKEQVITFNNYDYNYYEKMFTGQRVIYFNFSGLHAHQALVVSDKQGQRQEAGNTEEGF